MTTDIKFSDIRKKLKEYDGPSSKDNFAGEFDRLEILPFGSELPEEIGRTSILVQVVGELVPGINANVYIQKDGRLTHIAAIDIADIGVLYDMDADPDDTRIIGAEARIIESSSRSVVLDENVGGDDEEIGQVIIDYLASKIGKGIGGLPAYDVDCLMKAAIQLDLNNVDGHFDHSNPNSVKILGNESDLMGIQTKEGICAAINEISEDNHNGIYIASYPTGSGHQISLVFDNRNKTIYMTNSISTGGDIDFISKLNDKSIHIVSGVDMLSKELLFARQGIDGTSCGICTYVNSLNIASRLSNPANPLHLRKTRELEISCMIIDSVENDDRKFIHPELLARAVDLYLQYENTSDLSERNDLKNGINQALKDLSEDILRARIRSLESKEDSVLLDVPEISNENLPSKEKVFSARRPSHVGFFQPAREVHESKTDNIIPEDTRAPVPKIKGT